MTDQFTKNYRFTKPDFNVAPWHAKINADLDRIDEILFKSLVADGITVWTNSTAYTFGDVVVDPDDGTFWMCFVAHTSVASGDMQADRAAHPTYWNAIALSVTPKGPWTNDTQYYIGDIVTDVSAGITAICIESHVSSPAPNTLQDDAVYWSYLVQISAANTPFTPGGTIASTNVQAAILELDSENQSAHATMSNNIATNAANIVTANMNITNLQNSRVRYDVSGQGLSAVQMTNARVNIGAFGFIRRQVFTVNGTYTPHAQMLWCYVQAIGGGGGGGGVAGDAPRLLAGAGGAGGDRCEGWFDRATIGASRAVTIGAGGAGATAGKNNGGNGGSTIMASIILAGGGGGGAGMDLNGGGRGGASLGLSSGGVILPGSPGADGFYYAPSSSGINMILYYGRGGRSWMGIGAITGATSAGTSQAGNSAIGNTGGGGSGGTTCLITANVPGGNGGSGYMVVTEFCAG